jgi:hypothetical protein
LQADDGEQRHDDGREADEEYVTIEERSKLRHISDALRGEPLSGA